MPLPELEPLARRMEARFDALIDQLVEQLPSTNEHYRSLPPDQLRAAAIVLYRTLRASLEEGGIEEFERTITSIGRHRLDQGGSTSDLLTATDMVRQINLSLVNELAHQEPNSAAPAFLWLDRLSSTSLKVFTHFAQESLARQAEELNISITLSERLEHAQRLNEAVDAVFEQLPGIAIDRAIVSLQSDDDPMVYEIVGVFDSDPSAPIPPQGTRFTPESIIDRTTPDKVTILSDIAHHELSSTLCELLTSRIQAIATFPLREDQGVRGILILGYHAPHKLTIDEQRFLELIVRMLSNRMANLILVEQLREQVERATIFRALIEGANDMIVINDLDGVITYANAAAARLLGVEKPENLIGQPYGRFVDQQDYATLYHDAAHILSSQTPWKGVYTLVTNSGERIPVISSAIPLQGVEKKLIGIGGIARDERERLSLIEELRQSNADQQHVLELLRQLSTPLVPVMEGILVMPIVGDIDSRRASQIMETLLEGVSRVGADTIILDITGVPLVDTGVANALIQAARAVRLLGAEALLVGITPEVAQTLVGLGANLRELVTRGDLRSGITYALQRRGYHIVRDETAHPALPK